MGERESDRRNVPEGSGRGIRSGTGIVESGFDGGRPFRGTRGGDGAHGGSFGGIRGLCVEGS